MYGGGFDDGSGQFGGADTQFGGGQVPRAPRAKSSRAQPSPLPARRATQTLTVVTCRVQFGGGGAFGGGAFDGGNMSQGGGFAVDNNGPDANKKSLNKQSLMPCTIKQLKNAPASGGDNAFTVDNHDLHQVTIVGLIVHADEQNTNLQFTIDDGTGTMQAKMW